MRRPFTLYAAALLLPCAATLLFALALAPRTAGQSAVNMNGNMSGNMNRAAEPPHPHESLTTNLNMNASPPARPAEAPRRPRPAPAFRWSAVASVSGYVAAWPLRLRAGAGERAALVAELEPDDNRVEFLEAAGEFVRVRVELGHTEGRQGRVVEGWAAWGEVAPDTTALVIEPRTGRVLKRLALGPGIDSVAFSPDGRRVLFHGEWARQVYEADASDLGDLRQLAADAEGSFGPAAYVGAGREMLLTFSVAPQGEQDSGQTLYAVRGDDGGPASAAPFARSPAGAEPARVAFAPDGRLGFAFYTYPFGDEEELPEEEDRGTVATVVVFDPLTLQPLRRFKLPDHALDFAPGLLAMNADGSEFYLLDHAGQRLVVVETQSGGLLREVSLAGESRRTLALAKEAVAGAGPLVRFWESSEEHHGEPGLLRVNGGRAVPDESGAAFIVEAAGTLYAVDETGTSVFTLDARGRPSAPREIPRRESDHQTPVGLYATPDGSRLILLLALPQDGC